MFRRARRWWGWVHVGHGRANAFQPAGQAEDLGRAACVGGASQTPTRDNGREGEKNERPIRALLPGRGASAYAKCPCRTKGKALTIG
jgi:hypothetical protein